MPYYYSSTNTPVQNSGRQISLSLKDLDASVGSIGNENYPENKSTKQQDKECSDNTLRSSYHDVDQHEQHYQQNVHTLLNKSNGSKYEEMIKKFLSSTNHSETGTAFGAGAGHREEDSTAHEDLAAPRTPGNAIKTRDEISLVASSTKLAERAVARQSRSALLRRSEENTAAIMQQEVITEVLAAPLDRNKYVPPNREGVPTNQYGRQRAAPRLANTKSPVNSPSHFQKSKHTRSALHAKAAMNVGASRSVSVSIEDFNEWIVKNQSWREKVAEKKQQQKSKKQQQDSLRCRSPNLATGVQLQAERSYIRKHSRGRSPSPGERYRMCSRSPSPRPDSRSQAYGGTAGDGEGEGDGKEKSCMQLDELEDHSQSFIDNPDAEEHSQSVIEHPPAVYETDVFRRLYEEGKQYNEFNETMDEERSRGRFRSREV